MLWIRLHIAGLLAIAATSALASHHSLTNDLNTLLKDAAIKPYRVGIIVQSMKSGNTLYQHNATQQFMPASTAKLLTAATALHVLGPDFRYQTLLQTNADAIKKHTLPGNLVLTLSGDPTLTSADIRALVMQLKQQGITRITGRVGLDTHAFNNIPYAPGWAWDDLAYAYAAPTVAANLDHNEFQLQINAAKKAGRLTQLRTKNLLPSVARFTNHLRTTRNTPKHCPIAIYSDRHNHYTLMGCFHQDWHTQYRSLAITDPTLYTRIQLKHALQSAGIRYPGRVTLLKTAKQAELLASHRSEPLRHLVTTMLKESDNLIADSLLKTLGAHISRQPGSWTNGIEGVENTLGPLTHIDFNKALLVDGAGLSRYNSITPFQMARLLQYSYHDFNIEPELLSALPIAGHDGTLLYRMQDKPLNKNVRGKTGTLTGASSLAGFLTTKDHRVLSFVILINNFIGKARPYRQLEDAICQTLAHDIA